MRIYWVDFLKYNKFKFVIKSRFLFLINIVIIWFLFLIYLVRFFCYLFFRNLILIYILLIYNVNYENINVYYL